MWTVGGIFPGNRNTDQTEAKNQHHEYKHANIDHLGAVPRQNDFAKDRAFVEGHIINRATDYFGTMINKKDISRLQQAIKRLAFALSTVVTPRPDDGEAGSNLSHRSRVSA